MFNPSPVPPVSREHDVSSLKNRSNTASNWFSGISTPPSRIVITTAPQRIRLHHDRSASASFQRHVLPGINRIRTDAVQQRIDIQHLHHFCRIHAACQIQTFPHHALHDRQIFQQFMAQLAVADFFQAQAQAGQRRLPIVGDRGQRRHRSSKPNLPPTWQSARQNGMTI